MNNFNFASPRKRRLMMAVGATLRRDVYKQAGVDEVFVQAQTAASLPVVPEPLRVRPQVAFRGQVAFHGLIQPVFNKIVRPLASIDDDHGQLLLFCLVNRPLSLIVDFAAEFIRDLTGHTPHIDQFYRHNQTVDSRWKTDDVLGLARAMYEDINWDLMPLLHEALMDAGCNDRGVLDHCKAGGAKGRGDFLIDLLLDKT